MPAARPRRSRSALPMQYQPAPLRAASSAPSRRRRPADRSARERGEERRSAWLCPMIPPSKWPLPDRRSGPAQRPTISLRAPGHGKSPVARPARTVTPTAATRGTVRVRSQRRCGRRRRGSFVTRHQRPASRLQTLAVAQHSTCRRIAFRASSYTTTSKVTKSVSTFPEPVIAMRKKRNSTIESGPSYNSARYTFITEARARAKNVAGRLAGRAPDPYARARAKAGGGLDLAAAAPSGKNGRPWRNCAPCSAAPLAARRRRPRFLAAPRDTVQLLSKCPAGGAKGFAAVPTH